MKDIVLNEAERGAELLRAGRGLEDLRASISLVARYDVQAAGIAFEEAVRHVADYAKKAFPEVHPSHIDGIVPHYVRQAEKYPLSRIAYVPITEAELVAIGDFEDRKVRCLAFSALALAKYDTMRFEGVDYWIRGDRWGEVMRRANVEVPKAELGKFLHTLYAAGLLGASQRVGNCSIRVQFADVDGEPILRLTDPDFKDLGYAYRAYEGEPFRRCAECGRWIRQAKNGRKKYCDNCSATQHNRVALASYHRKK